MNSNDLMPGKLYRYIDADPPYQLFSSCQVDDQGVFHLPRSVPGVRVPPMAVVLYVGFFCYEHINAAIFLFDERLACSEVWFEQWFVPVKF